MNVSMSLIASDLPHRGRERRLPILENGGALDVCGTSIALAAVIVGVKNEEVWLTLALSIVRSLNISCIVAFCGEERRVFLDIGTSDKWNCDE